MEIDKIAIDIYNEKPKPKFSIGLNLDINSTINEQFEIISLLFLRGIEEKIIKNNQFSQNDKDNKNIIIKNLILLKIYFNSIGLDFKYENILKKEIKNLKLKNTPEFYVKNHYNFNFIFLKNFYKNGKKYIFFYNHKKKENNLDELFIIIKLFNHNFKIIFNFLNK